MLLKRTDKNGVKYYINAFTGQEVKIERVDPLKREPNMELQRVMAPKTSIGLFLGEINRQNNLRSAHLGQFKQIMSTPPKKRDKKQFVRICKRVNENPYFLMDKTF